MLLRLVNLLGTGRVAEGKDFWERSGQKDQALAGPGSADPSKVVISLPTSERAEPCSELPQAEVSGWKIARGTAWKMI